MKKSLLSFFSFLFLTTAFANSTTYKLLHSTNNWAVASNWLPAGIPQSGDIIQIPASLTLTVASDLNFSNLNIDIYGTLLLSGNNMRAILTGNSSITVHTSGVIDGSKASQQIVFGNDIVYKGNTIVLGPKVVTMSSNGFVPFTENSILPVTFASFTVTRSHADFQVQWATGDENAAGYYEVQRSTEGTSWKSIATIFAAGHTTNNYTFTDKTCTAPVVYYRIKQVDADGGVAYTAVRVLKNNYTNLPTISAVQNNIRIAFAEPVAGKVTVEVIRLNGSVVKTQTIANPSGTFQLATSTLHGVYIVRINNGQELNTAQQLFL